MWDSSWILVAAQIKGNMDPSDPKVTSCWFCTSVLGLIIFFNWLLKWAFGKELQPIYLEGIIRWNISNHRDTAELQQVHGSKGTGLKTDTGISFLCGPTYPVSRGDSFTVLRWTGIQSTVTFWLFLSDGWQLSLSKTVIKCMISIGQVSLEQCKFCVNDSPFYVKCTSDVTTQCCRRDGEIRFLRSLFTTKRSLSTLAAYRAAIRTSAINMEPNKNAPHRTNGYWFIAQESMKDKLSTHWTVLTQPGYIVR